MAERAVVKRSISIKGHRTSISLEAPFWEALREIAERENRALAEIVAEVDTARNPGENLSSALRCAVLARYRAQG
jgi:predicted DNA-binding ribbon-helix-helix protein